jgi:hypothetical protein
MRGGWNSAGSADLVGVGGRGGEEMKREERVDSGDHETLIFPPIFLWLPQSPLNLYVAKADVTATSSIVSIFILIMPLFNLGE